MGGTVGVAAVERALTILDAFTDRDPRLSLADLAKRTKMYKSTLLRLARSLENFGYLVRDEDGTYRLGSKLLQLGSLYQRHLNTADIVPDVLRSLVERVAQIVHVAGAPFRDPRGQAREPRMTRRRCNAAEVEVERARPSFDGLRRQGAHG